MQTWHTVLHELGAHAAAWLSQVGSLPAATLVKPDELRTRLDALGDLSAALPLPELTADIDALLRRFTTHATHPRHFGMFIPTVHPAGVIADALAATYNPQLGAWW
jgi:hypothetical protein